MKIIKAMQYLLMIIIVGLLCSCISDVSHDPQYNLGFKYNHVYKTIDEVLLNKEPDWSGGTCNYLDPMSDFSRQDRHDYLSLSGRYISLPKGTLFRVEKLRRSITPEVNSLYVTVRILNGHFKNIQATCFLTIEKYSDPLDHSKKFVGWWKVPVELPDPACVVDLGERPEYNDEKSIPEPEPISYTP